MKVMGVRGLSKTGKTTVVEALTQYLIKKGFTVGTVKEIHSDAFYPDERGRDTDRHKRAGASVVTALGNEGNATRWEGALTLQKLGQLYGTDFVLWEGCSQMGIPKIVTGRTPQEARQRMDQDTVAFSGIVAQQLEHLDGLPVIHCQKQVGDLAELVCSKALEVTGKDSSTWQERPAALSAVLSDEERRALKELPTETWEKFQETGLTREDIFLLIQTVAIAHCAKLTIGLASGIRAAIRCLGELGAKRDQHEIRYAQVQGNYCFGQAMEITLGLPAMKGDFDFTLTHGKPGQAEVYGCGKCIQIQMAEKGFSDGMEVLTCPDEELFERVVVG